MTTIKFNVNDHVLIKLTRRGFQLHYDRHKRACAALGLDYAPPKTDKEGWSRWQLWQLMADFGTHISMGMDPPFETTIKFETK